MKALVEGKANVDVQDEVRRSWGQRERVSEREREREKGGFEV